LRAAALAPDGRVLALESEDNSNEAVTLWDGNTGKKLHQFAAEGSYFSAFAFSPDTRLLATACSNSAVLVWDLASVGANVRPDPPRPGDKDLDRLWVELIDRDAARAYRAVQTLTAAPAQAVPLLQGCMAPAPDERYRRLMAALEDDRYAAREAAAKELAALEFKAEAGLVAALEGKPSLEFRKRAEGLLAPLRKLPLPQETVRHVRAVQVLEQIGSPEARQVLAALAGGGPGARLTREAKASLERLALRTGKAP
jgi:hypothetical protein